MDALHQIKFRMTNIVTQKTRQVGATQLMLREPAPPSHGRPATRSCKRALGTPSLGPGPCLSNGWLQRTENFAKLAVIF